MGISIIHILTRGLTEKTKACLGSLNEFSVVANRRIRTTQWVEESIYKLLTSLPHSSPLISPQRFSWKSRNFWKELLEGRDMKHRGLQCKVRICQDQMNSHLVNRFFFLLKLTSHYMKGFLAFRRSILEGQWGDVEKREWETSFMQVSFLSYWLRCWTRPGLQTTGQIQYLSKGTYHFEMLIIGYLGQTEVLCQGSP